MLGKLALILMLLISICSAETVTVTFTTPENWTKSESQNGSQFILKDQSSFIRIDIFKVDNNTWNNFNLSWNPAGPDSYKIAEKAKEIYDKKYIMLGSEYSFGVGSGYFKADGADAVGTKTNQYNNYIGTSYRPKSIIWLIAWTKPEYKNKILGIYGYFTGTYPEHSYMEGNVNREIPVPLWDLLESIHVLEPINVTRSTYQKNNFFFEVPDGWNVINHSREKNDTQIVLSDGTNAIRIDLIKHSGIGKLIGEYLTYHLSKSELESMAYNPINLTDATWPYAYEKFPWYSNDAICDYYKENIVKPVASGGTGSGISVMPDGVEYAGVSTNADSNHSVNEWIIAWTKPNYDDEIIGVHSLFKGEFQEKKVEWHGSNSEYSMPEPLWIVLTTFTQGDKSLPKAITSSSLAELV